MHQGCVATASNDARRGVPLVAWCCLFVGGGEREQGTGCLQARNGSLSANASRAYCSVSFLLACMMSPAPILPVCDSAPGAQHTCIWAAGARAPSVQAHAGAALQAAPLAWPSPALGPSTKIVGLGWRGPSRCRRRWRRRPARPPRSRRQPWCRRKGPALTFPEGVAACRALGTGLSGRRWCGWPPHPDRTVSQPPVAWPGRSHLAWA